MLKLQAAPRLSVRRPPAFPLCQVLANRDPGQLSQALVLLGGLHPQCSVFFLGNLKAHGPELLLSCGHVRLPLRGFACHRPCSVGYGVYGDDNATAAGRSIRKYIGCSKRFQRRYVVATETALRYDAGVGSSVSTRTVPRNRGGRSPGRWRARHEPKDQTIGEASQQAL